MKSRMPALLGAGLLLALTACGDPSNRENRLEHAIEHSVDYLIRTQNADGSFVYRVSLTPELAFPPAYNLLRHAGALYALGTYAVRYGDTSVVKPMQRAASFMIECCIGPVGVSDSLIALWSPPEITLDDDPLEAKLGGAGLAIIGLTRLEAVSPGTADLELMRGLGRFIRFLQKPDGSFYSKFIPSEGGRDTSWTSLYYPGEAALGLIYLYELDPDTTWLNGAVRAMDYLAESRRDSSRVPADHWALVATAALFDLPTGTLAPETVNRLYGHATQVARSMLGIGTPGDSAGVLQALAQPTSTATRLEGLLAIQPHLRDSDRELAEHIRSESSTAIDFLLLSQFPDGPHSGGIPRRAYMLNGEFVRRGDIRVDYVQHALSALLAYERLQMATR